jgi:GntR family transcriptional regulator, transcriptional repressor for pyruvate dehydrogenase complex
MTTQDNADDVLGIDAPERSLTPVQERAAALGSEQPASGLRPRRVRRAYEQVYDQLRDGMLNGQVANGERLPSEPALAAEFGVSRSTVRDALRLLMAEGLIRTAKGAGGGSFVTLPTVDHVSDFLKRNIELLSLTDDVTLLEFLEARHLIEGWAVRRAALQRTDAELELLRAQLTPSQLELSRDVQFHRRKDFHVVLMDICGNALLRIAAQPIFSVLQTHLYRTVEEPQGPPRVHDEHELILAAIERRDADEAERLMSEHLSRMADVYRAIWQPGRGPAQ